MNGSMSTLGKRLIAGGLVLISALQFGCGGSDESSPEIAGGDSPLVEPVVPGAQIARGLNGIAMASQPFNSRVSVVPNDHRNAVVGLSISNATQGGAAPTIDADGNISWLANELDFSNTRELTVTATMREGPAVTMAAPVDVRKERLVHQTQLPASSGTIADPGGRYLVKVEPEAAGTPMNGTLSILEIFSSNGSFTYVVRVPVTSGAKVTVLDAPVTLDSALRSTANTTSGTDRIRLSATSRVERPRIAAAPATPASGVQANIGASLDASLSGDGRVANVGEVNVYTTRTGRFEYLRTGLFGFLDTTGAESTSFVYQVDGTCTTHESCMSATRGPVILVHGFRPWQSVGGGEDTWGSLAETLKSHGHPVFELRWNNYMRFEEAAGVLARLSRRVAEITGNKVTIIAHSFGGVVSHTAMTGNGITFVGTDWVRTPVDGVFQRLITLGSPLSGIAKNPNESLELTEGQDNDDVSIRACEAITCFQAGSSTAWDASEILELEAKVGGIDPTRIGLSDFRPGETIRALHAAWRNAGVGGVPVTTVVSVKQRPFDDYFPDLTNETAWQLSDGLISLMGQAVLPTDFSARPFGDRASFDIENVRSGLGANFLAQLDTRYAANMEYRSFFGGREYYFALRAAHTSTQNYVGFSYRIAYYPLNGRVDIRSDGEPEADHPLRFFIEHASYLDELPTSYGHAPLSTPSVVYGRLVRDGLPATSVPFSVQLELAATGAPVTDWAVLRSGVVLGEFSFDAAAALQTRFPGQPITLSDYVVVIRAGTGLQAGVGLLIPRTLVRTNLGEDVNLGDIDVSPVPATGLVGLGGVVIDGQTQSATVAGATVYLLKGRGQTELLMQDVADTKISRRLTADALGRFSASGLEPGYYSALVAKAGFVTQTQGSVLIAADGSSSLTFSLLRVLADGEAAITLRWGAATDGVLVSSDLDSHLQKFDSSGVRLYEIAYYQLQGNATDSLDRDDTTYQGPETITLALDGAARYVYFLDNFVAGNGSLIGPSRPTVSVRIGQSLREFSLPPGEAGTQKYWKVFEIVNGAVVPCAAACLVDLAP
jgi:Carboxypeptidase regulatory-like domain